MKDYRICVLPGDGEGPSTLSAATRVLDALASRFGFSCSYEEAQIGGCAIDAAGTALPSRTVDICRRSDAVLFATVGGPRWDADEKTGVLSPEQGLLELFQDLGLFCNLRPVTVLAPLMDASPLKRELVQDVDFILVRELTGGIYYGPRKRRANISGAGGFDIRGNKLSGQQAFDTMFYREYEIERIVRRAFDLARSRKGKLLSVDKADVLDTSRLWREVAHRVSGAYPDVELTDMLVEDAAMRIVTAPADIDVIVTENLFGDILAGETAAIAGFPGVLASALLGGATPLFEPAHDTRSGIGGHGCVGPMAMLVAVELMLRFALDRRSAADALNRALTSVLERGYRTSDTVQPSTDRYDVFGAEKIGDLVIERIEEGV